MRTGYFDAHDRARWLHTAAPDLFHRWSTPVRGACGESTSSLLYTHMATPAHTSIAATIVDPATHKKHVMLEALSVPGLTFLFYPHSKSQAP